MSCILTFKIIQGLLYFLAVVEVEDFVADNLLGLVALAGNEDNVAGPCYSHGVADCLAAVDDGGDALAVGGVEPGKHVGEYGVGVFVARVVAGEDYRVGAVGGRLLP